MRTLPKIKTAAPGGTGTTEDEAHAMNNSVADFITKLCTVGGLFLTKKFSADGSVEAYDDAASFKISEVQVGSLEELSDFLEGIHEDSHASVIRGKFVGKDKAVKGNVKGTYMRQNVNFDDCLHHWFMVDIDKYEPGFSDPVHDPVQAIKDFIDEQLPACFKDVSFHWQLSSSAGTPGKEHVLKAHVWFWSETAYTSAQMYAWAKEVGPRIDKAVYRRIQHHYTANPIFEEGVPDPVPVRSGFHQGSREAVPLVISQDILEAARATGSGSGGNDMKLIDPSEKEGLVGAYHRVFEPHTVLMEHLEGMFEPGSNERRWTWLDGGGTPEGVWLHDDGMHVGATHNTWPIDGIANLWDLVRILKFGHLDQSEDDFEQFDIDERPIQAKPSSIAMLEWARGFEEVQRALAEIEAEKEGARQADIAALLGKITAAKSVGELTREIAGEAQALLAETNDPIARARINAAIQARAKKLDGVHLPIAAVRKLTQQVQVAKSGSVVVDADDQLAMAKMLTDTVFCDSQGQRLAVRSKGSWYVFNGRCYEELETDEKVSNATWQFLGTAMTRDGEGGIAPVKPTRYIVAGVVDALRSVLDVDVTSPPAWLPGSDGPAPEDLLVMANGILNIQTHELIEHTPRLFAVNELGYDFDPEASCPNWQAFLDQVLPCDVQSQQLLQEWFGYCLTADTSQQKFLMLIGQKRSGKGTVGRMLQAMLGGGINTIGPTLASLSKDFGLESWIGKLAAVFGDTRSGGKEPQTVVERILSIVGEDTLTVDRKHRGAVSTRLTARITILSNELLRLGDASGALIGRMLVLEFGQTFYGREDTSLERRLLGELPGILNWALAGKRRLAERGSFVQPVTGLELLKESSDANSPIAVFIQEHCEIDPMFEESLDDLFEAWGLHCSDENRQSRDRAMFAKDLRAAFPEVKKVRRRGADGRQANVYHGVKLAAHMRVRLDDRF